MPKQASRTLAARRRLARRSSSTSFFVRDAQEHPDRIAGAVFIGPAFPGGGEPLPDRTVYDFDREYGTEEGWAKYNRHYWLRDYRDFVEFFISKMFTEPHSTKPIEDAVGIGNARRRIGRASPRRTRRS